MNVKQYSASQCLQSLSLGYLLYPFWPTVLSVAPLAHCVVCLSVTFCIVAKQYVLAKKCLKE